MLGANGRNETIYYHGKSYEYIIRNEVASQTTRQHKYYIYAEGQVVAIQQCTENQTAQDCISALSDKTSI